MAPVTSGDVRPYLPLFPTQEGGEGRGEEVTGQGTRRAGEEAVKQTWGQFGFAIRALQPEARAVKTEKQKMLAGELYNALDPELSEARRRCRDLCQRLNASSEGQEEERRRILVELFGGPTDVSIQPPFFCDYGTNIRLGSKVYFNFNCLILDVMPVEIGSNVLFGPSVHIYAATHPLDADERRTGLESGRPVTIGSDVWVGGGAIICPGVTIGDRSVIGAGSVVTRSVPADVIAAGNPCRVIRPVK